MKLLASIIILITMSSCETRFSSMTQAIAECEKWAANKEWSRRNQMAFRFCNNEKETSQVLGYEQYMSEIEKTNKPIEHFRY